MRIYFLIPPPQKKINVYKDDIIRVKFSRFDFILAIFREYETIDFKGREQLLMFLLTIVWIFVEPLRQSIFKYLLIFLLIMVLNIPEKYDAINCIRSWKNIDVFVNIVFNRFVESTRKSTFEKWLIFLLLIMVWIVCREYDKINFIRFSILFLHFYNL